MNSFHKDLPINLRVHKHKSEPLLLDSCLFGRLAATIHNEALPGAAFHESKVRNYKASVKHKSQTSARRLFGHVGLGYGEGQQQVT